MSNLTPDQIRSLPMDRSKPYNGLTREQCVAIGIDPDEVEASRVAQNAWAQQQQEQAALNEAAAVVTAAQQAVEAGQYSPAEVAEILKLQSTPIAHQMFVQAWVAEEAAQDAEFAADDLINSDAASYAARLEAENVAAREAMFAEHRQAVDQLAAAQVVELGKDLDAYVSTTPGAFQRADAYDERLRQLIAIAAEAGEESPIPATPEDRGRMIQQAARDVELRDSIATQFNAQVETEHHFHEKAEKRRRFEERKSDDRSVQQREKDAAAWRANRLNELVESSNIDVDSARALPPTPAEISTAEAAKYAARERTSVDFAETVAGLTRPKSEDDLGAVITEDKAGYREAMQRAEATAQFGEFAVKSGYGDHAATAAKKDGPIDEYGDALGFGGVLSRHGSQD